MKAFATNYAGWLFLAATVHTGVFLVPRGLLADKSQYGLAPMESVEVSLVEAETPAAPDIAPPPVEPPAAEIAQPPPPTPEPEPEPPIQEPVIVADEPPTPVENPPPVPAVVQPRQTNIANADRKSRSIANTGNATAGKTRPSYLHNPQPVYPAASKQAREEGLVLLKVDIDERGKPTSVELKCTCGYSRLDNAACDGVRRWRFRPARIAGLPVRTEETVPVRFRLNK